MTGFYDTESTMLFIDDKDLEPAVDENNKIVKYKFSVLNEDMMDDDGAESRLKNGINLKLT